MGAGPEKFGAADVRSEQRMWGPQLVSQRSRLGAGPLPPRQQGAVRGRGAGSGHVAAAFGGAGRLRSPWGRHGQAAGWAEGGGRWPWTKSLDHKAPSPLPSWTLWGAEPGSLWSPRGGGWVCRGTQNTTHSPTPILQPPHLSCGLPPFALKPHSALGAYCILAELPGCKAWKTVFVSDCVTSLPECAL